MGTDAITMAIAYEANNCFRPLDWRLRLARRIVAGHLRAPRHREHASLRAAVHFLREEARCRTDRGLARLRERWPAMYAARRLAEVDNPLGWEVRARIVAGQSDAEVAGRCMLSPETVHLFEALFFSVRDRLGAGDWISGQVIGPGLWRGFTTEEIGRLWMAVANHGGPLALDAVLEVTQRGNEPCPPSQGGGRRPATSEAISREKVLLAVQGLMMPADASLRQLGQLCARTCRRPNRREQVKTAKTIIRDMAAEAGSPKPTPSRKCRDSPAPMAMSLEIG
jgi:hypothetical protein